MIKLCSQFIVYIGYDLGHVINYGIIGKVLENLIRSPQIDLFHKAGKCPYFPL